MKYQTLVVEKSTYFLQIGFNRIDKGNAYNQQMLEELINLFNEIEANRDIRLVILKSGGRHFQLGADLDWLFKVSLQGEDTNIDVTSLINCFFKKLRNLQVPLVGLVDGACTGGGVGILSNCDIVVADKKSYFSISEVKWGLAPSIILPSVIKAIGRRNAFRYSLTAERFDAVKAKEIGLVHEVCNNDQLDSKVNEIVTAILENDFAAVMRTKKDLKSVSFEISQECEDTLKESHYKMRMGSGFRQGYKYFMSKKNSDLNKK